MQRDYYVVDAFTSEPFAGNPAAVIFDARGLADDQMLRIAAEFNLSETTFVSMGDPSGPIRFRWFTPVIEVDMCGHATIAAIHALCESDKLPLPSKQPNGDILIDTRSGLLTARVEEFPGGGQIVWLSLRPPTLRPVCVDVRAYALALRLTPESYDREFPTVCTQDGDLLYFVRDSLAVNAARPDFAKLTELMQQQQLRGLSLASVRTLAPSITVQSRYFAPTVGIDEDPVTGSVHGPLTVYLAQRGVLPQRDGLAGMMAVQGKAGGRAGVVYTLAEKRQDQWIVKIGGQAVTVMKGSICL